ncbi:hypothetical protein TNCV_3942901 [Trichonephila clavipes]|nr:hypothetical protein TNCV_3942901 [Trichonephila clavipes]
MKLIEFGKSRVSIALQWISSHCNISGNEKADRLAKAGSLVSQPDFPLPLHNIIRLIYSKLQINRISQYGDAATGKRWNILLNKNGRIPSSLPRSVRVACFRILTGQTYAYLLAEALTSHWNKGLCLLPSVPPGGNGW